MSDKSPRKNSQKTTAAKTLKEKRIDKKTKSDSKKRTDIVSESTKR
jgi:hypothetical protein